MAISTPKDANRVPTLIATLNTDGVTVKSVSVTASLHALNTFDGTTGSGTAATTAQRDANRIPAVWGVSSVDGVTPVEIWCDASGNLLTTS